ncbi:MAG: hypothetical protein ACYCX3_03695 [Thermoleophilia bacterium]
MARMIGGPARRRLGDESVRLATMAVAVLGAVLVVAGAIWVVQRTGAIVIAVLLTVVLLPVLMLGKVLADRALVGTSGGRRAEDTGRLLGRLARLPDGWWVVSEPVLSGAVVETLVLGPRGIYAVEVFRWLTRDTGSAFHEKVATELSSRARDMESALGRLTNLRGLAVQPVFFCVEEEGVRVGDLLLHASVEDLRALGDVAVVTPVNLEAFLRAPTPHPGLRAAPLDPADIPRLVGLFQKGGAAR